MATASVRPPYQRHDSPTEFPCADWCGSRRPTDLILFMAMLVTLVLAGVALIGNALAATPAAPPPAAVARSGS